MVDPNDRVVSTLMDVASQMLSTASASAEANDQTKTLHHVGAAMGTLSFLVYRFLDLQSTMNIEEFKVFTAAFDQARVAASEVPHMFGAPVLGE